MKCKACGYEEHEGHADDCPWTQLHEMELERDSAVEALAALSASVDHVIAKRPPLPPLVMAECIANAHIVLATWKAGR